MKGHQPNAEQKKWRENVRQTKSVVSGLSRVEIHHVLCRTAKIKGIGNIGHYFILPLDREEHSWIDWGQEGLKKLKDAYIDNHGPRYFYEIEHMTLMEFQKFLFGRVCEKMEPQFSDDIFYAIQEWHR